MLFISVVNLFLIVVVICWVICVVMVFSILGDKVGEMDKVGEIIFKFIDVLCFFCFEIVDGFV